MRLNIEPCPRRHVLIQLGDIVPCDVNVHHRLNGHTGHYVSYGRHDGNQFHYNDTTKTLSVSYLGELKHNHRRARLPSQTALSASSSPAGEDEQPMTVVHYHCSPNRSASVVSQLSLGAEQPLHMWVESPCACPNYCAMGDLGVGTIFLIILSLSAAAYFILGNALYYIQVRRRQSCYV